MAQNTTLSTVTDYITDVRTLLQDEIAPYRYSDPSLLVAFNVALLEGRRLRPDLFIFWCDVPYFSAVNTNEVKIEPQFRLAFVFSTASHAMARDQEDFQDSRSSSFMRLSNAILLGTVLPPLEGGSPPSGGS